MLGDLGQQREMLKGTQKRLYGVANTLGVSGDTIRMVERVNADLDLYLRCMNLANLHIRERNKTNGSFGLEQLSFSVSAGWSYTTFDNRRNDSARPVRIRIQWLYMGAIGYIPHSAKKPCGKPLSRMRTDGTRLVIVRHSRYSRDCYYLNDDISKVRYSILFSKVL